MKRNRDRAQVWKASVENWREEWGKSFERYTESMVRGKRGESRHRWVTVHGEELSKRKSLAGRLEGVTKGVSSGLWEEWFKKDFGENVASSLEGKGKKLEKRGLQTELDWKSSRIYLQTKKVGGMVGRVESGASDGLLLKRCLYCKVKNPQEIEK